MTHPSGADAPQVSCVMAVNRDDGFGNEAILSILNQEDIRFELIIVANNCTEELWSSLQHWNDPRIRLFRTSIGQLPFNLNYGIDQARAPLIARMDFDDIAHPERLKKQWEHFQKNPKLDVLGTAYKKIGEHGEDLGRHQPLLSNEDIRRGFRRESQLAHPTVMFRRASVLRFGAYAYGLFAEDFDLWLRMSRDPNVVFENLPDILLSYRHHGNQMTDPGRARRNFADLFPLFLREFWLSGDPRFLTGLCRRWFFSSHLWTTVRPFYLSFLKRSRP